MKLLCVLSPWSAALRGGRACSLNQNADAVILQLVITFGRVVSEVAVCFLLSVPVCALVAGCVICVCEAVGQLCQIRFGQHAEMCKVIISDAKLSNNIAELCVGTESFRTIIS